MTRWYSVYYCIVIFGTPIWLHGTPSTFALTIEQDQMRVENSLRDFMAKRNTINVSMDNVTALGKRIVGKFSICGLRTPRKLNLCKRALTQEDVFDNTSKIRECKPRVFKYVFTIDHDEKKPKISMYQCPKLLRWHSRTGTLVPDPRQLYVSRMSSGIDQAMVFKREYDGGTLLPVRHLLEITKEDLDTEPPIVHEIRSRGRFRDTPVRSHGSSPAPSSIRNSPRSSPSQMYPAGASPQMSPTSSSVGGQFPRRGILGGTSPSILFGPLARIPQSPGTSRPRTKSTTSTPSSSPLRRRTSRPATPATGSGISSPYDSPSLSPLHSGAGTSIQPWRRPPPQGIVLRGTTDSSRLSSASASGESTGDSGRVTAETKPVSLGSSRFAGTAAMDDNVVPSRRRLAESNIQPGQKHLYRHKSFDRDRPFHSESNSPPTEGAGFPGFSTPAPAGTSVADMLGRSPSPGGVIQRTHSEHLLGTQDNQNIIYPKWPKLQQESAESSKKDSEEDSSANRIPNVSEGKISISQWRQFQKEMRQKSKLGEKYRREVPAAKEDISQAPALDVLSAYDENLKRHHTDMPSVLADTDYPKGSLHQLLQQDSSEESDADLADISTSESLPAMRDTSKHLSVQTDSPGGTDLSAQKRILQKGTSSRAFHTAASGPSEELFEEGTTVLSQGSHEPHSTGADENLQTALPGTEGESDQTILFPIDKGLATDHPVEQEVSGRTQVDLIKSDIATTVSSASADTLPAESTIIEAQTDKDTADQVDESGKRGNIDLPGASTDIPTGKLIRALSGSGDYAKASTSDTGRLETNEALVVKSTYQQTRPSSEGLRSRSRSVTPPRRSPTTRSPTVEVKEPKKDTTALLKAPTEQVDKPETSTIVESEYQEPVVVKPIHREAKISSESLRRRSRSTTPTRRPRESGDTSAGSLEHQSISREESSSTSQKNESTPSSKDTDITQPEKSEPSPPEPQPPSDDGRQKKE